MEFWERMTAYLLILQPDHIGCHVIFNTDKMEGHKEELGDLESRGVAWWHTHVQGAQPSHQPVFHWNKPVLCIHLPFCTWLQQAPLLGGRGCCF